MPTPKKSISKSSAEPNTSNTSQPVTTLGGRNWTTLNLDITQFRNGDPIPQAKTQAEWAKASKEGRPAWCVADEFTEGFGKLYNWYAVIDPRGLAPVGFRVAGLDDWKALSKACGGNSKAGSQLKSPSGWSFKGNGPEDGVFKAMPGGYRDDSGEFGGPGQIGYWWTSAEANPENGNGTMIYYGDDELNMVKLNKGFGLSVRCVEDVPTKKGASKESKSSTEKPSAKKQKAYSRDLSNGEVIITLSGWGGEVIIGHIDVGAAQKLEELAEDSSFEKIFKNDDALADIDLPPYNQIDDLLHLHAVSTSDCSIKVTDSSGKNIIFESGYHDLTTDYQGDNNEEVFFEVSDEEEFTYEDHFTKSGRLVYSFSGEKGVFFKSEISLADGEEFDSAHLALIIKEIVINTADATVFSGDFISEVRYKDVVLKNHGGDTKGISFEASIVQP